MSRKMIEDLIFSYARRIDTGDFPGVAELFRHGRICSPHGEPNIGYDAVLALYQSSTRLYPNGTPCTRHLTTNLSIDIQGDQASSHCYFTVMQALPDFPLQAIISGHYEDQFEKAGDQWRFSCRSMYPELLGDLSRHLLFDIATLAT
ncbi:MAG: nuclear transport factor 2 family protein [Halioglobus sp.]